MSFLGSFALFLNRGLTVFAIFYTLGNIISLASTCFLMGPVNQIKKMFAPTRIIATIIVLVSIGLTLFAAIKVCFFFYKFLHAMKLMVTMFLGKQTWFSVAFHNNSVFSDDMVFVVVHTIR